VGATGDAFDVGSWASGAALVSGSLYKIYIYGALNYKSERGKGEGK